MTQHASMKDAGTLYQPRNNLDRRDVGRDASNRYRASNTFVNDVLYGYIVACAVTHFGM